MMEKRNTHVSISHDRGIRSPVLHQHPFLDTFLFKSLHPIIFRLFLPHPAAEDLLESRLLLLFPCELDLIGIGATRGRFGAHVA